MINLTLFMIRVAPILQLRSLVKRMEDQILTMKNGGGNHKVAQFQGTFDKSAKLREICYCQRINDLCRSKCC